MKNAPHAATAAALMLAFSLSAQAAALSGGDSEFATKAAGAGMKEVELSKLAKDHAASADVKALAETMVKDHGAANQKLMGLARDNGWTLPGELDADAKKALADLQGKKGADFDKAYLDDMVQDHAKAVDLFSTGASSAQDPKLRDFAKQTLPTVKHHQSMANDLQKKSS